MISHGLNAALIIGHPGHELRVHRFMEIYQPVVFVLTDGSGSAGSSRIHNTLKVIKNTGSREGAIMGRFTDKEIYQHILQKDIGVFRAVAHELASAMASQQIEMVAGDSNEGFSPTHDLCRYLINSAVKIYAKQSGKHIPNYEFYLEAAPHKFPEEKKDALMRIQLNDDEFERKYQAARAYHELAFELDRALEKFGKKPFQTENLWPADSCGNPPGWKGAIPDYEITGRQRVANEVYDAVITYQNHMLPLAKQLYDEDSFYQ